MRNDAFKKDHQLIGNSGNRIGTGRGQGNVASSECFTDSILENLLAVTQQAGLAGLNSEVAFKIWQLSAAKQPGYNPARIQLYREITRQVVAASRDRSDPAATTNSFHSGSSNNDLLLNTLRGDEIDHWITIRGHHIPIRKAQTLAGTAYQRLYSLTPLHKIALCGRGRGHHLSPTATWGKFDFSADVLGELDKLRIPSIDADTGKNFHGWSVAHSIYSSIAGEKTWDYMKIWVGKGGLSPDMLCGKEARKFAQGLGKHLEKDKFILKFNNMIRNGVVKAGPLNEMLDQSIKAGEIEERHMSAATVAKYRLSTKARIITTGAAGILGIASLALSEANGENDETVSSLRQPLEAYFDAKINGDPTDGADPAAKLAHGIAALAGQGQEAEDLIFGQLCAYLKAR